MTAPRVIVKRRSKLRIALFTDHGEYVTFRFVGSFNPRTIALMRSQVEMWYEPDGRFWFLDHDDIPALSHILEEQGHVVVIR